jgi:hypothetical protein
MKYYRLALQNHQTAIWNWKTTVLTSLQAVFHLLRIYSTLPQDRIRMFTAASKEELHEMLCRENNGLASDSVTAARFLYERRISVTSQNVSAQGTAEHIATRSTVITSAPLCENDRVPSLPGGSAMGLLERKRLEMELGGGGDRNCSYLFSLSLSTPQLLAWTRLRARIQAGELHP